MKNWDEFTVTPDISAKELGELLIAKFGTWAGTSNEQLLEDGGTMIDHLSDDGIHSREILMEIPEERWAMAWEYFHAKKQGKYQ